MNRKQLGYEIALKQREILLSKQDLMRHKRYFQALSNTRIAQMLYVIVPFAMGINAGSHNLNVKHKLVRRLRIMQYRILPLLLNKALHAINK